MHTFFSFDFIKNTQHGNNKKMVMFVETFYIQIFIREYLYNTGTLC